MCIRDRPEEADGLDPAADERTMRTGGARQLHREARVVDHRVVVLDGTGQG